MKQTAVEWLVEQFNLQAYIPHIEQAKEMEKQQIIDADLNAYINGSRAQAKLMYSEEEVIELLKTFDKNFNSGIVERNKGINEWFEQYKNK